MRRPTSTELVAALLALAVSASASAEEPALGCELRCRPEAAPGRVLCELKFSAKAGARVTWADALVTAAPAFVRPLRARVTPERFKQATATERRLSLAFVATASGVGQVSVKARAVVCRGPTDGERCVPITQQLQAEIRVGS